MFLFWSSKCSMKKKLNGSFGYPERREQHTRVEFPLHCPPEWRHRSPACGSSPRQTREIIAMTTTVGNAPIKNGHVCTDSTVIYILRDDCLSPNATEATKKAGQMRDTFNDISPFLHLRVTSPSKNRPYLQDFWTQWSIFNPSSPSRLPSHTTFPPKKSRSCGCGKRSRLRRRVP